MPKVQVCVGMVASGKSTFAKLRAKEGAIILNDDSIVNSVHGQNYDMYNEDLKPLYKGIGYGIMSFALGAGRDVVVDRTNLKRNTRQRYLSAAKSMDAKTEAVIFPMHHPKQHARRRVEKDGRGFGFDKWFEVAQKHFDEYVRVSENEGFDVITKLSDGDIYEMLEEK